MYMSILYYYTSIRATNVSNYVPYKYSTDNLIILKIYNLRLVLLIMKISQIRNYLTVISSTSVVLLAAI